MKIVGVGYDAPATTAAWVDSEGFEFEVWTDDDRTLAVAYGAAATPEQFVPLRKTVVVGVDGQQLLEYAVTDFGTHPAQVLDDCRLLFGD